jgi:hypothetical protein
MNVAIGQERLLFPCLSEKSIGLRLQNYAEDKSVGTTMSELLKAVEAAARKLASTMAARDVVQRSLDGIIAEQERRAAAKEAAKKAKHV